MDNQRKVGPHSDVSNHFIAHAEGECGCECVLPALRECVCVSVCKKTKKSRLTQRQKNGSVCVCVCVCV